MVGWDDGVADKSSIIAMLDALAVFGPARQSSAQLGRGHFGLAHSVHVAEDQFDQQPLVEPSGRVLVAADARIDNRDEIVAALAIQPQSAAALSDAMLFAAAWERWEEAGLARILGDMAFAVWDNDQRELILGRTPATSRSLFYHIGRDFAAFASMPTALYRLEAVPKRLNLNEVARRLSGSAFFGTTTSCFADIDSVEPGTIVRIHSDGRRISRFWDPAAIAVVRRTPVDAADELRAELDRSVEACLRRSTGMVASQLSGGRDSAAVTAAAALALGRRGEQLTAYTAAPRTGFPSTDGRYLMDESSLAASVVADLPNVRHIVSRSRPVAICALLDQASRLHFAPMGGPANMAYWQRILGEAHADGTSVLLTGTNGNFSISLGGLGALSDVARENGLARWWSIARRTAGEGDVPWRTILNQSFGHHLPPRLRQFVRKGDDDAFPLFAPAMRDRILAATSSSTDGALGFRSSIHQIYRPLAYADKIALAQHGIELRDPTADRRLIEFCLSLPADQIVGSQGRRPVYDLAFADRVPAAVRTNPLKGFQGADWFEVYDPDEIGAGFRRYAANRMVRELIDIERVFPLLDAWPQSNGYEIAAYRRYASHMMLALALASFVDVHFPEQRDR